MPLSEMPPPVGTDPGAVPGAEHPLVRIAPPGPMSRTWLARLNRVECPSSFAAPDPTQADADSAIVYASAIGSNVVDVDGNRYVDLAAGFGAILLGHLANRPARALEVQAERLWMGLGDVFASDAKVALLERISALHPTAGARVLLCQSGSDAITAGLKTAALNTKRPGIVAFQGAYHGLGYGPLSVCGYSESFRNPFDKQLNPHVKFVPYPSEASHMDGSLQAARDACAQGNIGAIVVEPVLGRGGCVVPPQGFLAQLLTLAHDFGALLIADEIWTGLGRCGALLACSRENVCPDILCLGKGLGGGLPIAACVASNDLMQAWKRNAGVIHTSTFQGHALACATGVAVIDTIKSAKLPQRAETVGSHFAQSLRSALVSIPIVRGVGGVGLMIGITLDTASHASAATRALLKLGYILLPGGSDGNVLTITPPLTIAEDLLERFVHTVASVLEDIARV